MKKCSKCGAEKPLTEYHKRSRSKDGYNASCKACRNTAIRADYRAQTEREGRTYTPYNSIRSAEKEGHKVCSMCDIEKPLSEYHKKTHSKTGFDTQCRSCVNARKKAYNQRPEVKAARNEYERRKRQVDPSYRLRLNISNTINSALRRNEVSKAGQSVMDHLPYTIEELRQHLESQFTPEMSWDNYGSFWHIDHIVPQVLFPYTRLDQYYFEACWSLKNLRPLEATLNMSKGAKVRVEGDE